MFYFFSRFSFDDPPIKDFYDVIKKFDCTFLVGCGRIDGEVGKEKKQC